MNLRLPINNRVTFFRGMAENLPTPRDANTLYFVLDEGKLYCGDKLLYENIIEEAVYKSYNPHILYGTDDNGDQTEYDVYDNINQVIDVKFDGENTVSNKVAYIDVYKYYYNKGQTDQKLNLKVDKTIAGVGEKIVKSIDLIEDEITGTTHITKTMVSLEDGSTETWENEYDLVTEYELNKKVDKETFDSTNGYVVSELVTNLDVSSGTLEIKKTHVSVNGEEEKNYLLSIIAGNNLDLVYNDNPDNPTIILNVDLTPYYTKDESNDLLSKKIEYLNPGTNVVITGTGIERTISVPGIELPEKFISQEDCKAGYGDSATYNTNAVFPLITSDELKVRDIVIFKNGYQAEVSFVDTNYQYTAITIFIPEDTTWGTILGPISAQTDLYTILNSKAYTSDLAKVATSGSYVDLLDKPTIPTIPTYISSFTNDVGYVTDTDLNKKVDKNVAGSGSKIVQDITFDYDSTTGDLKLTKKLLSLEDGSYQKYEGTYVVVTPTQFNQLSSDLTTLSTTVSENYSDLSDEISLGLNERVSKSSFNKSSGFVVTEMTATPDVTNKTITITKTHQSVIDNETKTYPITIEVGDGLEITQPNTTTLKISLPDIPSTAVDGDEFIFKAIKTQSGITYQWEKI
jgi:uncharacterized protein (UPF0218 family)